MLFSYYNHSKEFKKMKVISKKKRKSRQLLQLTKEFELNKRDKSRKKISNLIYFLCEKKKWNFDKVLLHQLLKWKHDPNVFHFNFLLSLRSPPLASIGKNAKDIWSQLQKKKNKNRIKKGNLYIYKKQKPRNCL